MNATIQWISVFLYNLVVFVGTFSALYYTGKWYCLVGLLALSSAHVCDNTATCPICIAKAKKIEADP